MPPPTDTVRAASSSKSISLRLWTMLPLPMMSIPWSRSGNRLLITRLRGQTQHLLDLLCQSGRSRARTGDPVQLPGEGRRNRRCVRGCSAEVTRASYASQCSERTTMPFVLAIEAAIPPPAGEEVTS